MKVRAELAQAQNQAGVLCCSVINSEAIAHIGEGTMRASMQFLLAKNFADAGISV